MTTIELQSHDHHHPQNNNHSDDNDVPSCPEDNANFLSRMVFWWMNGLISRGYRKVLEFSDLPGLRSGERSDALAEQFRRNWYSQQGPKRSLLLALHRCYGTRFYAAAALKLVYDIMQLTTPMFVKLVIEYIADTSIAWYWGYIYIATLFIVQLVGLVLIHQYFHIVQSQGIRLRSGLRAAVFEKISKLSNNTRQKMNTGEITNLYSIDSQRLSDLLTYLHMIWSSVFQMTTSLLFLYLLIGWSTVVAIVLMFAVIPLNGFLSRILQKLRRVTLKWTGERIKTVNEILQGIRVIKLYAWTTPFLEKAFESRASELKQIRRASAISLIGINIMSLAPLFISVSTFTVYALLGNKLSAAVIFPALSYFNLLRFPMQFFPTIVTQLAEAKVSIDRLQGYLNAPELPERSKGSDAHYPIKIADGDFVWDEAEDVVDLASFRGKNDKNKKKQSTKDDNSITSKKKKKKKKEAYTELEEDGIEEENNERQQTSGDGTLDTITIDLKNDENIDELGPSSKSPTTSQAGNHPILRDININIEAGKLTAIVGLVGSGKSSMLSAILGELKQLSGTTEVSGSIAYAPQQAWIQTGTLRDNILFGRPMIESKYQRVIESCCLTRDLEILPAGDETEIGEKGINLSGGQRQRVSLARCLYADSDVLLLDDVLSAVDAHVGKRIFFECISNRGLLANKTRVLVTHQWHFLRHVDHIIVLENGQISEQGSYEDLIKSGAAFSDLMSTFTKTDGDDDDDDDDQEYNGDLDDGTTVVTNEVDDKSTNIVVDSGTAPVESGSTKGKIIKAEERAEGTVKFSVYKSYFTYAGGVMLFLLLVSIYAASQGAFMGSTIWMAYWSSSPEAHTIVFFLSIYLSIGIASGVLQLVRELLSLIICLRASRRLHDRALERVVYAPMDFFDSTPIGRIINRFSKDTETIDTSLISNFKSFLWCLFQTASTLLLIIVINPLFILPLVPISIVYYIVQRYYRRTSRELKRLDSISRSPMFSHFSEALVGISTIRAFDETIRFNTDNEKSMDQNNRAFFYQIVCQRWLGLRLELLGLMIVFFTALFAVIFRGNEASVGLTLTYALQITGTMNWLVRMIVDTENAFNAVERVLHYCEDITQEPPAIVSNNRPDAEWPATGNIVFENVVMRYRPELDPVLKGLSVDILGSEKIGICGRTGAGKSTMCSVIFRLVEIESGTITIDGVDIGQIGLDDLRSRLSIIPQDPVLFSGTIRFNLDPFGFYTDRALWQALERSHLKEMVESLPLQLEAPVAEYGENFSVGQRQLLCLARAILKKTKVLVLDEATGSVDVRTDALIQQTVRTEFADRTVLTVAHRLNTIIDSDRVMVLDSGKIVDMDSPSALLDDPNSQFSVLVSETGAANATYLRNIASGKVNFITELEKMILRAPSMENAVGDSNTADVLGH